MIYESRSRRNFRRECAWHRCFAWWPQEVGSRTVWLGHYWTRWVPEALPRTEAERQAWITRMALAAAAFPFGGSFGGHYEYRLTAPDVTPTNVTRLRA